MGIRGHEAIHRWRPGREDRISWLIRADSPAIEDDEYYGSVRIVRDCVLRHTVRPPG
jgi:hypothetical protein